MRIYGVGRTGCCDCLCGGAHARRHAQGKYEFEVVVTSRSFRFRAASEALARQWQQALEAEIAAANSAVAASGGVTSPDQRALMSKLALE